VLVVRVVPNTAAHADHQTSVQGQHP